MADIATLGLRVDATELPGAITQLKRLADAGDRAESSAKRLQRSTETGASASARRAQAIRAEAGRIAELQRMNETAAAAHAAHLRNRAAREASAAAEQRARSREAGRQAALAQMEAAERVYREEIARIKVAQAQGLLSPRDAAQAGRESAIAFNRSMAQTIQRGQQSGALVGAQGRDAFVQLAGSLKNVEDSGKRAGLGLARLNNSFVVLARQATGAHPAVGRLADTVGTFAIGTAYMIPVLAGIAALGAAWQAFTRDARRAKEEARRAADALLELRRQESLDIRGEIGFNVDNAVRELDRLEQKAQRLGALAAGAGATPLGALFQQMAENVARDAETLRQAIDVGERKVQETLRERGQEYAQMLQERRNEERRIQEERVRQAREHRRALAEAVGTTSQAADVGLLPAVEAERELTRLRDELQQLAEDENIELAERVRLLEAAREAEEGIKDARRRAAIELERDTFDARDIGFIPGQRLTIPTELSSTARAATRELELTAAQIEYLRQEEERLRGERANQVETAVRATAGVVAFVDGLGLVEGRARSAIRGISDLATGIQSLDGLDFDKLDVGALIGGVGGLIGGAVGLIGGLLSGGDEREVERQRLEERRNEILLQNNERLERLRQAMEDQRTSVDDLAAAGRAGQFIGQPGTQLEDLLQRLRFIADLESRAQGGAGFVDVNTEFLDEFGISIREFMRIAGELDIQLFDENGRIIAEAFRQIVEATEFAAERLRQEADALRQDVQLRILRAQGQDDLADKLARQIERETELARAAELGDQKLIDLLRELYGLEDAALAAAEAAAKAAQEFRQAQFGLDLLAREQTLEGDDRGAFETRLRIRQAEEEARARDLLEAGDITQQQFNDLIDLLGREFVDALRDFDVAALEAKEAALEAAQAEKFRAMVDMENLRIRLLVAQGQDEEAQALRNQLEIMQALQEGRDEEYIALLRQVQAAEAMARARAREQQATERATRAIDGFTRVLNAPTWLPVAQQRFDVLSGGRAGSSASSRTVTVQSGAIQVQITQQPGQNSRELAKAVVQEINLSGMFGAELVFPEAN